MQFLKKVTYYWFQENLILMHIFCEKDRSQIPIFKYKIIAVWTFFSTIRSMKFRNFKYIPISRNSKNCS